MNVIFSEEDSAVHHRSRSMRGGMLNNYHTVHLIRDFSPPPPADLWFHGLSHHAVPFPDFIRRCVEQFSGKILIYMNDDGLDFLADKIPHSVRDKTSLFLRNCWPTEKSLIHPAIRDKTGLINPLLKPLTAKPGQLLKKRPHASIFYGSSTSGKIHTRVDALRMLQKAGVPLTGGLIIHPHAPQPRISFAFHGYNPLTYRLFEGFSRRCLVIAQNLDEIHFADCGLKAGHHYVAIRKDLTDLVDTTHYYLDHLDEAQEIADRGYIHFKTNFQYSGVALPQPLYRAITETWKGIEIPRGRQTPYRFVTRLLLPVIHSL